MKFNDLIFNHDQQAEARKAATEIDRISPAILAGQVEQLQGLMSFFKIGQLATANRTPTSKIQRKAEKIKPAMQSGHGDFDSGNLDLHKFERF